MSICKWLLALALPGALGFEIAHLVLGLRAGHDGDRYWGKDERAVVLRETITDAIGVGLTASPI